MRILEVIEAMQELARALHKPCMYIGSWEYCNVTPREVRKAAPYLNDEKYDQLIADGCGILVFDDELEMEKYFQLTVGDDGPTLLNPYRGEAQVYALTCSAEGNLMNSNT